jgi:hypothetical protein
MGLEFGSWHTTMDLVTLDGPAKVVFVQGEVIAYSPEGEPGAKGSFRQAPLTEGSIVQPGHSVMLAPSARLRLLLANGAASAYQAPSDEARNMTFKAPGRSAP